MQRNRGKTRDIFKEIRDTKGTCKDGHNKGQKLYESKEEYTENYTKKDNNDSDNMMLWSLT